MRFLAIDFETANADLASICQIGIVAFEEGQNTDVFETLLDPEDFFDDINTMIHGIDETSVVGAPVFTQVYDQIRELLSGQIVVCHTAFDRVALSRAIEKYSLQDLECQWLDSARVTRRAWPQFAWKEYGLANVAEVLGITFQHHAAREDARASGEIVLRAISETGISLEEWFERVNKPIDPTSVKIQRTGNPDGHLYGHVVVFTGALKIHRHEAADHAAKAGCEVASGVTRETSLLVVGDQDIRKLVGHAKSSKHRKAEALIAKGQSIQIIGETDFFRLLNY